MAEATCWPYVLVVSLTYDNLTQHNRDAASMFAYADVSAWLKRLLAAARYERKRRIKRRAAPGPVPVIRFIVAGEQGSRTDRCHWHGILYSNVDVRELGEKSRFGQLVADLDTLMSGVGKSARKVRFHWDKWGHGFVTWQPFNMGSARYVLSYCLKDQFTVEKSAGTMREADCEEFATGLFRMSKKPAIGEAWLASKIDRLAAAGACLPALQLSIEGFPGVWIPSGLQRKRLLWAMRALYLSALWRSGKPPPQWSSLVASLGGAEYDLRILMGDYWYGKAKQEEAEVAGFDRLRVEKAIERARAERRRRCGGAFPCRECCHLLSEGLLATLGLVRDENALGQWFYRLAGGEGQRLVAYSAVAGGVHPFCAEKHSKESRLTFFGREKGAPGSCYL